MSFLVDGTITYTQEGKINCTIVDIENKQKYTIDQSGIIKTETISDEYKEKLISCSQSGESGDVGGPTGDDVKKETDISSNIDTNIVSFGDENPQQDTVAENINTQIKDKKIPDVTKLEFVLQKSPETGAAEEKTAILTGSAAAGTDGAGAEEKTVVLTGPAAAAGTDGAGAEEKSAVLTGPAAAAGTDGAGAEEKSAGAEEKSAGAEEKSAGTDGAE